MATSENITKLFEAIMDKKLGTVQYLIENKLVSIDSKNENGQTPIIVVSIFNREDILNYLIKKGADLNIKDNQGASALLYTLKYRHPQTLKILIDAGANVDFQAGPKNQTFISILEYYKNNYEPHYTESFNVVKEKLNIN